MIVNIQKTGLNPDFSKLEFGEKNKGGKTSPIFFGI